jgi:MoaA/NifB/PqqE/SkfB family radical SAM enzyme
MPEVEDIAPSIAKADRLEFTSTRKRTITKRGVLWLGQTCNLRCYFCYFLNRIANNKHAEHDFMSLEKSKKICHTLRYYYGNTAIDIQGGEPTIYPGILDLISYCREIGLVPTLITNGLHLSKPGVLETFKEAGIRDFLVSLHGIGPIHDEVVCKKGAYAKIIKSIERMVELEIPFRFNCTLSKPIVPILPMIAEKAAYYGANAVNYIAFNPFEDQETGIRTHDTVPSYSDIKVYLNRAMDILAENKIECNVRYMPICVANPEHRKNFYNFQQLTYDHHEWDYQSWMWTGMQPQRMHETQCTPVYRLGRGARRIYTSDAHEIREWYDNTLKGKLFFAAERIYARAQQMIKGLDFVYRREAALRAEMDLHYQYHEGCQSCSARKICDGFHGDYAKFFGTDEAKPITDHAVTDDPLHYIKEQDKVVEEEDKSWAL